MALEAELQVLVFHKMFNLEHSLAVGLRWRNGEGISSSLITRQVPCELGRLKKQENYRIMKYPGLEETHKDHTNPTAQTPQKFHLRNPWEWCSKYPGFLATLGPCPFPRELLPEMAEPKNQGWNYLWELPSCAVQNSGGLSKEESHFFLFQVSLEAFS